MVCNNNLFATIGILSFVAAVAAVIATYYYFRSIKVWHEHCMDWSNFLQRTHANFYDTERKKGEEIASKM